MSQSGTAWSNLNRANGDPNCEPNCSCSTTNCASNASGTGWLQATDFQDLPFDVTDGERYVTAVRVNVNGRYNGGTGGHMEIRIIVKDDFGGTVYDSGVRDPGNEYTNNTVCDWRIPAPERDITTNVNWNAEPFWLDNIEIWARRKGSNSNTLLVNALRVAVDSVPGPNCQLSATALDFGTTFPGGIVDRSFAISNTGGGFLVGNIDASDCNGEPFAIVGGGGSYSLGSGQSRTVTIRYAPTSPSFDYDSCSIEPNDTDFLCNSVDLTGIARDPCEVTPVAIDFGGQGLFTAAQRTFSVRNIGVQTFSGSIDGSDCDDFQVVAGGGAYSLSPGQSRAVTVQYIPTSGGYNF